MATADEESEVQENVVSTLNPKNSDLCSFSGMVKHVEGNMSRGMEKFIALFCYCYQLLIVSTPALRLYYNQSYHQRFRQ